MNFRGYSETKIGFRSRNSYQSTIPCIGLQNGCQQIRDQTLPKTGMAWP